MKNFVKWLGIIAFVAVIGFSMIGCFTFGNGNNQQPKPGIIYNGNGHSYEVVNQTMSWTDARRYCEERGGYLATITSSGEQAFIENLLARKGDKILYWLGGYRDNNGNFQWVTGEPFVYTNWNHGEPNNNDGIEDKIEIYANRPQFHGPWNDNKNDGYGQNQSGFICEWD